jgi:DNA-binding MarR family transcriptional regulator
MFDRITVVPPTPVTVPCTTVPSAAGNVIDACVASGFVFVGGVAGPPHPARSIASPTTSQRIGDLHILRIRHKYYELVLTVEGRYYTATVADPDPQLSLLFDVFALGQRVRTLVATALAGSGLRPDEYAAYSVVFEAPGVTMTQLARQLGMPVTTAADYVRAMIRRGHLRRDDHPNDSRAYTLTLTAAGLRAHRTASVAFQQAHDALLAELAPLQESAVRSNLALLAEGAERAVAALTPAARPKALRRP